MNAIIIDDEESCIESLLAKIEMFVPQLKVIKTYILPQEALQEIHKLDVDVIFLDIEMPNMNGITFAQKPILPQQKLFTQRPTKNTQSTPFVFVRLIFY